MPKGITLRAVLSLMHMKYGCYDRSGEPTQVTYLEFKKVMLENELINDERKIKEWWKNLKDLNYLIGVNKNLFKFNVSRVSGYLSTGFPGVMEVEVIDAS